MHGQEGGGGPKRGGGMTPKSGNTSSNPRTLVTCMEIGIMHVGEYSGRHYKKGKGTGRVISDKLFWAPRAKAQGSHELKAPNWMVHALRMKAPSGREQKAQDKGWKNASGNVRREAKAWGEEGTPRSATWTKQRSF